MNFRVCEYCGGRLELKEDPMNIELSELYERFGRQTRLISLRQEAML